MDRAVAVVAAAQHGIVTRAQLLNAGLAPGDIAYRLRLGRLIAVHRGVYAVGHLPPSPQAKAMAAVLPAGRTPSSATARPAPSTASSATTASRT